MSPIFSHRIPSPVRRNYKQYRPFIRVDFQECCAYCLIWEFNAGGEEHYELDHFKPRSIFPALIHVYDNIYYSCHACNLKKSDAWPTPAMIANGTRFVDPCNDDFSSHYQYADGVWIGLTLAAQYTIERIGLNRKHLVRLRRNLGKRLLDKRLPPLDWSMPLKTQLEVLEGLTKATNP